MCINVPQWDMPSYSWKFDASTAHSTFTFLNFPFLSTEPLHSIVFTNHVSGPHRTIVPDCISTACLDAQTITFNYDI